ncbi:MAG: acylphosphatase [Candidatus Altiarchaeota archaeon]|nr:acylphosphatase [Candidatus Altiarchaeota archaeon]
METAEIIVKGDIQRVGYRAKVMEIASSLGIKGVIENLKDGSVRIIAQGEEGGIKKFTEEINIRNSLINVVDVSVESFIDADKTYSGFKKVVRPKETDERLDSAVVHLKELIGVTREGVGYSRQSVEYSRQGVELTKENLDISKQMLKKQDQMLDKQDQNTEVLSGKLDNIHNDLSVNLRSFHEDTIKRFDVVDAKYGLIAESMEKIFNEIREERIDSRKSMEKLIDAVIKLAEKK